MFATVKVSSLSSWILGVPVLCILSADPKIEHQGSRTLFLLPTAHHPDHIGLKSSGNGVQRDITSDTSQMSCQFYVGSFRYCRLGSSLIALVQ